MKKSPEFIAMKIAINAIYPALISDEKIIDAVQEFVNKYPYFENIQHNLLEASLRIIRNQRDYV